MCLSNDLDNGLKNIQQLVIIVIGLVLVYLYTLTDLAMDQIPVDCVAHVLAHEIVFLIHRYLLNFLQLTERLRQQSVELLPIRVLVIGLNDRRDMEHEYQ